MKKLPKFQRTSAADISNLIFDKGLELSGEGRCDDAAPLLRAAVEAHPQNGTFFFELGFCLHSVDPHGA